jgi:uncharacterized protein (TIGR02147 family)
MVLKENSPLSPRVLVMLAKPLGLNREEMNYWAHLAALVDAKSLDEQKQVFRNLSKTGLYKSHHKEAILAHQYFSNWYYVAIRELANRKDFSLNPKWVSDQLVKTVPLTEVREALDFLIEHGLIIKIENGKYSASERNIQCEGVVYRMALTEFYKQTYEMCVESIYETPREERYLTSHSLAISEDGFAELQSILVETVNRLQALTKKEDKKGNVGKCVYHVSLAGIPMSKKEEKL